MQGLWAEWWVWAVAAIALGVLEILAPGYIFLGIALGAAAISALVAMGVLGGNIAVTLLAFAVVSLIAWVGVRKLFGVRKGQVKVWDRDINDDV